MSTVEQVTALINERVYDVLWSYARLSDQWLTLDEIKCEIQTVYVVSYHTLLILQAIHAITSHTVDRRKREPETYEYRIIL